MAIALSMAYTATPLAAGVHAAIFATDQLSAGVSRPSRKAYRLIAVTAAAAASPANVLAAYNAKFGALVSGRKIFFKVILISAAGFASAAFESSQIVA